MEETSAGNFGELAIELDSQCTVGETIDCVVRYALTAVDCDSANVVFVHQRPARVEIMASTDAVAEEIGRVLVAHGEGPALALPEDPASQIVVHDTGSDPRWPRWAHALVDLGIHSVLSARLATRKTLIGALSLYAKRPLAFDYDDIAVAQILAQHASVALAASRHEYVMGQAVDARKRIGQAQGLLMERHGINADRAFDMLRRYSQAHRMKLNTVAQCVIDGRRDIPQDTP